MIGKCPAKGFPIGVVVDTGRIDIESFFLSIFIYFLNVEVNFVSESVPRNLSTIFVLVGLVGVDTDDDMTDLGAIRQDVGYDLWFIMDILPTHLAADSIHLSDLGNNLLQFGVYFSELLVALLSIHLSPKLLFHFGLVSLSLLLESLFLLAHPLFKLGPFLVKFLFKFFVATGF